MTRSWQHNSRSTDSGSAHVSPGRVCCVTLTALALVCVSAFEIHAAPRKRKLAPRELSRPAAESQELIEYINGRIEQTWKDNEVTPSKEATDGEWLRRVYLDVVGHIPPVDVVEEFLKDSRAVKRSELIENLLSDTDYARNWCTIWTNLSIGRQTPRLVSRTAMQSFYRDAFGKNRPWKDVVYDLLTAKGHYEENGATNFLLAQMGMNDEAVQATAKSTRLFMGIQVQCTQCHDHPFNDWDQAQFWQFNSFFRQTRRVDHRRYDPETGRRIDDYSELVPVRFEGPVYFEKRNGVMEVAFPQFFGEKTDPGAETDRRLELGKHAVSGEKPLIAQAMVNRMWGHFFGYGFTKPVDDLGPHNPATHPELLDRLSRGFVTSGYDMKQLIRWICNCDAYHLSSQIEKSNAVDDPAGGETALFSHLYVKSMEAEQLYDSLIIATNAQTAGRADWKDAEKQRLRWMRQFIIAFGTDENDEATTFNGSIPQALMIMNGDLVATAISGEPGTILAEVLKSKSSDSQKVEKLYLTTLGRSPSREERTMSKKLIRANSDPLIAYQDLLWALLNSNEFIFNH